MIERSASTAAGSGAAEAPAVKAPLFASLIERLEDGQRWVVLDLGAPQASTLSLLSRFRCKLVMADLVSSLPTLDPEEPAQPLEALAEQALPPAGEEAVDLVLCWDLLNYLRPPALQAMMSRVAARGHSGMLVHALIAYSSTQMPARPGRWSPQGDDHLVLRADGGELRAAPRYSPEELQHRMPDFRVERAMLLRNGMQEFLLRL